MVEIGPKYCLKCHREAALIVKDGEKIKIIQGRSTLISLGEKSKMGNFKTRCPAGHEVNIEIGESDGKARPD